MSEQSMETKPRRRHTRSVAMVAALCALAAAGGYTGATWLDDDEIDPVQVTTGNLDVDILRRLPGDRDRDGVRWWAADDAADPADWDRLDEKRPLVFPGDLVVATVTFRVGLEGHNLLADLRLEGDGGPIQAKGKLARAMSEQGAVALPGRADATTAYAALADELSAGGVTAPAVIELPSQTQVDDASTYTLAALFRLDGSSGPDGSPDLDGMTAGMPRLEVVLEQVRHVGASARTDGGA